MLHVQVKSAKLKIFVFKRVERGLLAVRVEIVGSMKRVQLLILHSNPSSPRWGSDDSDPRR